MTITTENATSVAELERLKVLKNGEKVSLTFSDAEFERRLAGLRRIMVEKDLDAVVLTSYHSIKYYSDFLFTYFGRSYAMVVTKDDTVTVTANIDAGMPWRRSFGDNIVYTDWRRDNYIFAIQEVLRTRGVNVRGWASKTTPCRWTTATRSRQRSRQQPSWTSRRPRCASA
jgi:creatinase